MLQSADAQFEAKYLLYNHALLVAEGLQNGPKDPLSEKVVHTAAVLVDGIDAQLCELENEIKRLKRVVAEQEGSQAGYPDALTHNAKLVSVEREVDRDSRQLDPVEQTERDRFGFVVNKQTCEMQMAMSEEAYSESNIDELRKALDRQDEALTCANEEHIKAWKLVNDTAKEVKEIDDERSHLLCRIDELEKQAEEREAGTSVSQAGGSASGGCAAGGCAAGGSA
jgi:chromosome segregation ATPase